MTTYGKGAQKVAAQAKLDELEVLINAAEVAGDKKAVKQLNELYSELSRIFDDLYSLVDKKAEKRFQETLKAEMSKFLENNE